jgi:hypothetical protein
MFRSVDLVAVNKVDLIPHLDYDLDAFYTNLSAVNPGVKVIEMSARTGAGVEQWCDWLLGLRPELQSAWPGRHRVGQRRNFMRPPVVILAKYPDFPTWRAGACHAQTTTLGIWPPASARPPRWWRPLGRLPRKPRTR